MFYNIEQLSVVKGTDLTLLLGLFSYLPRLLHTLSYIDVQSSVSLENFPTFVYRSLTSRRRLSRCIFILLVHISYRWEQSEFPVSMVAVRANLTRSIAVPRDRSITTPVLSHDNRPEAPLSKERRTHCSSGAYLDVGGLLSGFIHHLPAHTCISYATGNCFTVYANPCSEQSISITFTLQWPDDRKLGNNQPRTQVRLAHPIRCSTIIEAMVLLELVMDRAIYLAPLNAPLIF